MLFFTLFIYHAFSKIDNSLFHMISLHCSNFSANFDKMTIQYPNFFTISPRSFNSKFEFHNFRCVRSITPFIYTSPFSKFDLTLSSCRFSNYLSTVILQSNDDYTSIFEEKYNNDSKDKLYSLMQSFSNTNPSSINIFNCVFENIDGNNYNDPKRAALRLITSDKGGSITISDTQFINCRSSNLGSSNLEIGGALYIETLGTQHCTVVLTNLIFSKCNSFTGAAFSVISLCPINFTKLSCRNINVTDFINLDQEEYFDRPRNVVDINNCLIDQFANILFERMNNQKFLKNVLCFSNCDGVISSLQFKDIEYQKNTGIFPIIEVSQDDGHSHTLIFDGLGFKNVQEAVPIGIRNKNKNNNNLNVVIDNFYYPGSDSIMSEGIISASISITHTETDGINIITPLPTVSESPTPSATDSPYPSITETPTPSASETPLATPSETPDPSVTETPIATPSETPSDTPSESPYATPPISPLETPGSPSDSPTPLSSLELITSKFSPSFDFSPSQNISDDFNPSINDRSVSGKADVGLIVGCTVAGIVLLTAIVLIILFFCIRKIPCCNCCEKTAFQPSDEESKTELCFFDETLNQAH